MINCGGFHIDEEKLKVIDNVLTKFDTVSVENSMVAHCGQLLLDKAVFKHAKDKNKKDCVTLVDAESVEDTIIAPCGGVRFDSKYFEVSKGKLTMKDIVSVMLNNPIPVQTTKVIFDGLEDFDIIVKDSKGNVVEPIEDKVYNLERTKTYSYVATNDKEETVEGQITTTSRQANLTKTIEF